MLRKTFAVLAISMGIFHFSSLYAQGDLPKDHVIRMQVEGMMMRDVQMISENYDPAITLYKFPNLELAKGMEAVKAYWTKQFEAKEEKAFELNEFYFVGNKAVCKVKKLDPANATESMMTLIIEMNETRVVKIYFLES